MGELFRRFWQPVMVPDELPEPDCAPVRLRVLGEDLIAFRDSNGQVGIVGAHCPHRGASLFFGRNEEAGLRCVYHGWKYDLDGRCVDMPNEPAESSFKDKIRATAYPARDWGGLVWVYMGPREQQPELPQMEWCQVPTSHRFVSKWYQDTNFMQGYEGDIDSSHSSFLHSMLKPEDNPRDHTISPVLKARDKAPGIIVNETDYGFRYGAKRAIGEGKYNWRITQALLPTFSLIPFIKFPAGGRVWVPVDDEKTMTFHIIFHPDRPLTEQELEFPKAGRAFPPQLIPGTFTPVRNKSNDYMIDRELQRTSSYTGVYGVNDQDRGVQESMGPMYDRRREHLASADLAIITARRNLLKAAIDLQNGIEPWLANHPEAYRVRAMDVNTEIETLDQVIEQFGASLVATATA